MLTIFLKIENDKSILMYADDTLLINRGNNIHETISRSQDMLDKVVKWCRIYKLTINIEKTKCMFINPTASDIFLPIQIKIRGTPLSRVHVYEYLGVHIDNKLNMNNKIDVVCKKVQQKHGILKKIQKNITRETALCIYKTMKRPHFDYGDYMIDSGIQSKIDQIVN